ncbi:hypothetical protein CPLU01_15540 [Colletotrichum plurivorum]|uniref:F-box domain-containing protein n=1 Tax=Colletotrichum plurivorum TaxID=2175906 RepID=A0A8H6J9U0_9PEZI|nr:hypothetical protein CPLU01_15540 [Colletotrichum plurivorum]
MTHLIKALNTMRRVCVLRIDLPGDRHTDHLPIYQDHPGLARLMLTEPRLPKWQHLQVAMVSWGPDPVPGPVLLALSRCPALRAVGLLPSTLSDHWSSAADLSAEEPGGTLRRLSTGVDDPQLLPLLANMGKLVELGIAVDWVSPSLEQFTPLAGMTRLERLSLTCPWMGIGQQAPFAAPGSRPPRMKRPSYPNDRLWDLVSRLCNLANLAFDMRWSLESPQTALAEITALHPQLTRLDLTVLGHLPPPSTSHPGGAYTGPGRPVVPKELKVTSIPPAAIDGICRIFPELLTIVIDEDDHRYRIPGRPARQQRA